MVFITFHHRLLVNVINRVNIVFMITIKNLHMKAYLYLILFLCTTNSIAQNLAHQMLSATFATKAVGFNSSGILLSGTIYKPKQHRLLLRQPKLILVAPFN